MMKTVPLPTIDPKDIVVPEPAKETLPEGFNLDHAWLKSIGIHATHIRYRDEFAKAYRTMGRLPLYSIQGAANHHKLNADMFDKRGNPDDAIKAQSMQQDELFEIVREA